MTSVHKLALTGAFVALAAAATISSASADVLGISLGATPTLFGFPNYYNLGYSFTPSQAGVSVTALGVFDDGSITGTFATDLSTGALVPELVGLWDSSGNLIASATVDASATQIGDWAFTSISPVSLTEGETYVVGAQGGEQSYTGEIPISVDPEITYLQDQWTAPASLASLAEPTLTEGLTTAANAGFFGGNIEIASTDPVPEPMSLTLFGAALAGFGLVRRRRKQA